MMRMPWPLTKPLPNQSKPEPNRQPIQRRDAEIAEISAEKTKTGRPEKVGFTRWRGWIAEQAESAEEAFWTVWCEFQSRATSSKTSAARRAAPRLANCRAASPIWA